jgi:Integrase core domain
MTPRRCVVQQERTAVRFSLCLTSSSRCRPAFPRTPHDSRRVASCPTVSAAIRRSSCRAIDRQDRARQPLVRFSEKMEPVVLGRGARADHFRRGPVPRAARTWSPWQNGYSERLIGSIRRDCLDHVVVFGEQHLLHLLNSYQKYYNEARTHLSLHKDAPIPRAVQTVGRTLAVPVLGGLHHQYFRA